MSGFRLEKEMWPAQKPSLAGKWDRYELMTPAGHPDVKGSHNFDIYYIENKVGDNHTLAALEESQKEYLEWLIRCGQSVYLCFGGTKEKSLTFYLLSGMPLPLFSDDPLPQSTVPPFWKGRQWLVAPTWRVCGVAPKGRRAIDTSRPRKRPLK